MISLSTKNDPVKILLVKSIPVGQSDRLITSEGHAIVIISKGYVFQWITVEASFGSRTKDMNLSYLREPGNTST